jgi:anti-sigma factor RsiW
MNTDCKKNRERIAGLVTAILPDDQRLLLQQHLSKCHDCKRHAQMLEQEELILAGFFADFDRNITTQQDRVIEALDRIEKPQPTGAFSFLAALTDAPVAKRALAAAVIVIVALYFTITLSWISQINLTCQSATEVLRLPVPKTVLNQR